MRRRDIFLGMWTPALLLAALLVTGCERQVESSVAIDAQEPTPRERISTERAPGAVGPYSQAIRVGRTLYLSGQIGLDPATGLLVEGGIEAQTRQVMENIGTVLEEAGYTFDHVVQAQVFLADMEDYGPMNDVYRTYFDGIPPARAAVQVAGIPLAARVEIMMTAVR